VIALIFPASKDSIVHIFFSAQIGFSVIEPNTHEFIFAA
jgi:hypothetical protein